MSPLRKVAVTATVMVLAAPGPLLYLHWWATEYDAKMTYFGILSVFALALFPGLMFGAYAAATAAMLDWLDEESNLRIIAERRARMEEVNRDRSQG